MEPTEWKDVKQDKCSEAAAFNKKRGSSVVKEVIKLLGLHEKNSSFHVCHK